MPNQVSSTYSENVKNAVNIHLGEDANNFIFNIGPFIGDEARNKMTEDHSKEGMIYADDRLDHIDHQIKLPWVYDVDYDIKVFDDEIDQQKMMDDFPSVVRQAQESFRQKLAPGDENIREFANAVAFNPAKRAMNGWPIYKLAERCNLSGWFKEFGAYLNPGTGDETRKQLAYCDAHYPINRMVIAIDNAIQIHTDYFDASEKKELTPEQEADFRQRLLEEETKILQNMKRVATVSDPAEGQRIQQLSGIGNPAHEFNRRFPRGIKVAFSDTEARVTGLKSGWPIEDLNALSSFKTSMDAIYTNTHYEPGNLTAELREVPQFRPGEQDYLKRMQDLWAKIEKTQVKDQETRKNLLGEMRDLVKEGLDKEFLPSKALEEDGELFSYALYDIERKIARELTPSEQEVMEHGEAYNREEYSTFVQNETDEARRRTEEYDRRMEQERIAREQREVEENARLEAERRAKEEQRLKDAQEVPDPRHYDRVMEQSRRRRTEEISPEEAERIRLSKAEAENLWFYRVLTDKRLQAAENTPINRSERPVSDQDDITRYYMGKKNISYDEALNLKLLPPEERRQLAEDYYDDLIAHPFRGVSEDLAVQNARYFGELDAQAARNMMDMTIPAVDLKDPEQVKNITNGQLGYLSTFTLDLLQNNMNLEDKHNLSSSVRPAYVSAFGTREEYAATLGKLAACNTLIEASRIVNNTNGSNLPLYRALGLHYLQKCYGELAGKKLSEIPSDKWMEMRSIASGIQLMVSDDQLNPGSVIPKEGAPTEEQIRLFLAGGESPFTEEYLKNFENTIRANRQATARDENTKMMDALRTGSIDSSRVYNLDYIRQNGGQEPLGPNGFDAMDDEQREKTHRIFEQTMGNLVSVTGMQPLLSSMRGESALDRFTINGKKASDRMRELYGDRFDRMTAKERETATEAELLCAWADPHGHVVFRPLNYDDNGNIVEMESTMLSTPVPQRVTDAASNERGRAQLFDEVAARVEKNAQQLNSIAPGVYQVFAANELAGRLNGAEPQNRSSIKQDFMLQYAESSEALAERVAGERPEMAAYLELQAGIARRAIRDEIQPRFAPDLPYSMLMDMVDKVHLPMPDAVDEKQPGPVFRAITDDPGNFNAFPLFDAAKSAEKIMDLKEEHLERFTNLVHPVDAATDLEARRDILKEVADLESHLDEMERVTKVRGRGAALDQAFDGDRTATGFVNGNPGLGVMRAELQGRRTALTQGWPVQDMDFIAGLYAKREGIRRAIEGLPEGSQNRLAYERSFRALNEICTTLDTTVIENAEQRKQILSAIDAYGPAVYNDITAGMGSDTNAAAFKASVQRSLNAEIPNEAFRTREESYTLAGEAADIKNAALAKADENEAARRQKIRDARKAEREDREIGEMLHNVGLFGGEEPEAGQKPEPEPKPEPENEDLFDRIIDDEHEQEYFIDDVLAAGQAGLNEEELDGLNDAFKRDAAPENDPNDFAYQSFDDVFATEEQKKASVFYPTDEYINMLEEDGSFFGNLFDQKGQKEANYDLYGDGRNFGFFEWQDMRSRLDDYAAGPGALLGVKRDRLSSVTNDLRAHLMSEYDITFEQAMELNTGDLVGRRQLASDYLDLLEAHPLNKDMTQEQLEASARFYGEMHRKAIEKFNDTVFPEVDLSSREAVYKVGNGPSMTKALGQFALDMSQDTENLFWKGDPAVQTAYIDAMGGTEHFSELHEQMSLIQSYSKLADTVTAPVNPACPLRNKAFGKFYLEMVNDMMRGKKLSEAPEGMARYLGQIEGMLSTIPVAVPEEGAPSDQELQDYIDGKIPNPFSDAYIEAANRQISGLIADDVASTSRVLVGEEMTKRLKNPEAVYDLSYIPVGPQAERPRPDYLNDMSDAFVHDTNVTFNKVFGSILYATSNGQLHMSAMRGEDILDRFMVDGKPVSQMPVMADLKGSKTPDEYRTALKAEIMQAMADPKRTVTYTPLTLDPDGKAVELTDKNGQIVRAAIPTHVPAFKMGDYELQPASVSTKEARNVMAYTMANNKMPMDFSGIAGMHNDPLLDQLVQHGFLEGDDRFYDMGDEAEGEMEYNGEQKFKDFNHIRGANNLFSLMHGLKADGTLTEEGQKNFRFLTDRMNSQYDELREIAGSWDSRNPLLGEMIRWVSDDATTTERGTPWMYLKKNYTYQNMNNQVGGLHMGIPTTKRPFDANEAILAVQGYPTGRPRYPMPYAAIASRRMAHTEAAQNRSQEAGTLTMAQDRLNRRMMLAEVEETKKQLNLLNAMHLASVDEHGNPDPSKPGLADVAYINRHLENDLVESSSYFARGTKFVQSDLNARHSLMCHGWPVGDISLLANLYIRRDTLRSDLDSPMAKTLYTPEVRAEMERGYKIMCEITGYLDGKDIKNAADREQALAYIDSYGDYLYNDTVMGGEGKYLSYKTQFAEMRSRQVPEMEFLNEQELAEFKESERVYQTRKDSPDMVPSVNGPQTDEERAFLNAEQISRLAEVQGQMEKDPAIAGNEALQNARYQIQLFTAGVAMFYRQRDLLDPANAEKRREMFENLADQHADMENALSEAEYELTRGGEKKQFTPAEEQTLKEIRQAKASAREMGRMYAGFLTFEAQRKEDLLAHEQKIAREARERAEQAEREERYMVDTDYAMSSLSEKDQDRLYHLLTDPIAGDERFDFETGQVIPAEPRELPERVLMAYDDNGEMRPQLLILADKQAAELEEDRREAIREERRRERDSRAAAAAAGVSPYDEGAADLFGEFSEDSYVGEIIRQAETEYQLHRTWNPYIAEQRFAPTERDLEAGRRRQAAVDKNDPRYEWSFKHILNDQWDKLTAARAEQREAANEAAVNETRVVSAQFAVTDNNKKYDTMARAILANYDADTLERVIQEKRPEWYEQNFLPMMKHRMQQDHIDPKADPAAYRNLQTEYIMSELITIPDRHDILSVLADDLPTAYREDLRSKMLSVDIPTDRPYEQQVTKPLHDRIQELKAAEMPVNAAGVPVPPGEGMQAYQEALDYADEFLDEVDPGVYAYANERSTDRAYAERVVRNAQFKNVLAEKDEDYRNVAGRLLRTEEGVVKDGVLPTQEQALNQILYPEMNYSPEYLNNLAHMLTRMEQMGIDPTQDSEQQYKVYAYEHVAKAKADLAEAIESGDWERIVEAKRVYQEKRDNMKELMDFAREHFSDSSTLGNVDSTRNRAVPWEYSGDFYASSHVNAVFQLYSALKQTGVSVQDFVYDPYDARRQMNAALDEKRSYKTTLGDRSIGAGLGTLMAENDITKMQRTIAAGTEDMIVSRAMGTLAECNPDKEHQSENRLNDWLLSNHRSITSKVRESDRNPFTMGDRERANEVLQLLSIVDEKDLKENYDRMVCGVCYDNEGQKIPKITAEQYIAGKQDFDYYKLTDRGAEIIRDAMAVEGTTFDPAAFMEERQKALSMVLTSRVADAGRQDFDLAEYEVTHTAEVYDMLRAANPQMNLPELTDEQRNRMAAMSAKYTEKMKQLQNGMSRAQRDAIRNRRRDNGDIAENARRRLVGREANRNRAEEVQRVREAERKRRADALQAQIENRRLAEEQRRAEAEAREAREKTDLAAGQRIAEHAQIPLTERVVEVIRLAEEAGQTYNAVNDPEHHPAIEIHNAHLTKANADERLEELLKNVMAAYGGDAGATGLSKTEVQELLTTELGAERASAIAQKLPQGVNHNLSQMEGLTAQERAQVLGAIIGTLSPEQRDRIIAADNAFVQFEDMKLSGSPYEPGSPVRQAFESQVADTSPIGREIRNLKADIYNNWEKYSGGKLGRKERAEFAAELDYAERMLRPAKPDVKSFVVNGRMVQDSYINIRDKQSDKELLTREENSFMRDLSAPRPGDNKAIKFPRADKADDIRRLRSENYNFDPRYIGTVAGMLRKMEQMQAIRADAAAEEGSKIYAFRPLLNAQNELKEAIRSKDRERILNATAKLKEVRRDYDDLVKTAEENFHPSEYMDNLDLVREDSIPWDYARNYVPTSQINAICMFGNALKDYGISVDEFERDPSGVIQKMDRMTQEKYATLKGFTANMTPGTIATNAQTNTINWGVSGISAAANGRHLRAVQGLILASPATDPEARARNMLINNRVTKLNTDNSEARQMRTLGLLTDGFEGRSAKGREAVRTLMVVDERDMDPDRMFTDPAIGADGLLMTPFSLSEYLERKENFDYGAQANRTDNMIKDAAREAARLKELSAEERRLGKTSITMSDYSSRKYSPYKILKARQEALTELLALRAHEKDQPGYQALAQELKEMPERYERLRQSDPSLNLPELTKAQKNELKAGVKVYDELVTNRAKSLEAEEKRLSKDESRKERVFTNALKDINKTIRQNNQRLARLGQRMAPQQEIDRAVAEVQAAENRRDSLIRSRAQAIADDYRAGRIPEGYAAGRLEQLAGLKDNNYQPVDAPALFGERQANPAREQSRLAQRERFLAQSVMEGKGFKVKPERNDIADSMRTSMDKLSVPVTEEWVILDQPVVENPQPVVENPQVQNVAGAGQVQNEQVQPVVHEEQGDRLENVNIKQMAQNAGININALGGQGAPGEMDLDDDAIRNEQNGPQSEVKEPEVKEPVREQPKVQVKPAVQEKPVIQGQPKQPGVQDKTFADLEKKLLGNKPKEEHHQRKDPNADQKGLQQNGLQQNNPQQEGPRQG